MLLRREIVGMRNNMAAASLRHCLDEIQEHDASRSRRQDEENDGHWFSWSLNGQDVAVMKKVFLA
jgi:hypothetical protein